MVIYNKDLDFIDFSTKIIREVDSISSNGKDGSENSQESRVNAFYRAIGLPGIITGNEKSPLQGNNGNLFEQIIIPDKVKLLKEREDTFLANTRAQSIDKSAFDFNNNTVRNSINGMKGRLQLFPMFVNASIPIYPHGKRVGGAFMTDRELKNSSSNDRTPYRRPLIETIISLRLNFLGAFNSAKKNNIKSDVFTQFQELGSDITESLELSLYSSIRELSGVKQRIDEIRKKTSAQIIPSTVPEQNTEIVDNPDVPGEIDIKQAEQLQYLAIKEARLVLFNFDDTDNQENTITVKNLKDSVFASSLLSASVGDAGFIEKAQDETNKKADRVKVNLKQAYRDLDLILGTFSGLSGFDVLVVLYALFTIPIESLIRLLNKNARERLALQTGIDKNDPDLKSDDSNDTIEAVSILEKRVSKIIEDYAFKMAQYKPDSMVMFQKPKKSNGGK